MNAESMGKLVLRLTVGLLMLFHGYAKIAHSGSMEFVSARLADLGLPGVLMYGAYVGEIIAPLMVVLGLYCRTGGLLIVINMVFAILLAHAGDLFSLGGHGGWRLELQGFYLFGGLAIMLLGSGRFALKPD